MRDLFPAAHSGRLLLSRTVVIFHIKTAPSLRFFGTCVTFFLPRTPVAVTSLTQ